MAKFAGLVGYVTQEETAPGVWSPVDKAVMMRGDFISQSASVQNDDKINSDVTLNHRVSLLGDAYAFNNYFNLKWIEIGGRRLEVRSVEIHRPRLIVSVGGMYNA